MSQLKEDEIQKAKNALDRLTGCDLSHLSLEEAKLIQALRDKKHSVAEVTALTIAVRRGIVFQTKLDRVQWLKPGETVTVNGQLFGREKDWKQE